MISKSSKTFVLDTNVLLHNPKALFAFSDNRVVIPMIVLEELDKFKTKNTELGRNSREVARDLDRLRSYGSLREGVPTDHGGSVQVVLRYQEIEGALPGLNDNRILGCAVMLKEEGDDVLFISKDINARIKADALGIPSMDYDTQKVNIDELRSGVHRVECTRPGQIEAFDGGSPLSLDHELLQDLEVAHNEFVQFEDADEHVLSLGRWNSERGQLEHLDLDCPHVFGIFPRNTGQRLACNLLMDPGIKLLTLVGTAGTGKTLLALAAGMNAVLREERYKKMLVSRPIMPMGQDIGYLPGTKDEKLGHWMGPIFDNLHFILGNANEEREPDDIITNLIKNDTIALEALTYIRGRSISNHYLIVDEAQNLSPHEIKTIISRAGEDTKIVLTGDPYQIDNPYLDASSNGLTYVAERMRGQLLAGHLTLNVSERSELSGLAADLL
ncbi:MAG: PhoH family protein [Planctomycetota bacterium]